MRKNTQTTALAEKNMEYQTPTGDMVKLNMQMVRKYLVQGRSELVTDQEIIYFMSICKSRKLNPFTRDCFLIKYSEGDKAAIVTSADYFRQNAMKKGSCKGWEKGVICKDENGNIRYSNGLVYDNEKLLGGWFRAKPEGWNKDYTHEVPLKPYIKRTKKGALTSFWSEDKQPFMIAKVAEVQGLRNLWGEEATGIYTPEEVPSPDSVTVNPVKSDHPETFEVSETKDDIDDYKLFIEQIADYDTKYLNKYIENVARVNNVTPLEVKSEATHNITEFLAHFDLWRMQTYPTEYAVTACKEEPPKPSFIPDFTARNSAMETDENKRRENNHQIQNRFEAFTLPEFKRRISLRFGAMRTQNAVDFLKYLSKKNNIPFESYVESSLEDENFNPFCQWFESYLADLNEQEDSNKKDLNLDIVLNTLNKDPIDIDKEEWSDIWEYCKRFKKSGFSAFILDNKALVENSPITFYNQCKEKWSRICSDFEWTYTHSSQNKPIQKMNDTPENQNESPKNPLIGTAIYQTVMNEEDMFPDFYQMALEKYGEPKTVEDCEAIHRYINSMVDLQDSN